MTDVTIALPYRGTSSRSRRRSFEYLYSTLESWFPHYEIANVDSGHEVFDRSATRNFAVAEASGSVVVVCDADTVPQKHVLEEAIEAAHQDDRLHLPYTVFRGLHRRSTKDVVDRGVDPHEADLLETATWSIGGIWVISKQGWENAGGMDERFRGWGYEDNAFFAASNTMNGQTVRHEGCITHLWHPRSASLTQTPDYRFNQHLYKRYETAEGDVGEMKKLLSEEGRRE